MEENKKTLNAEIVVNGNFVLSKKKNYSLWFVFENTRFFITAKKRDIMALTNMSAEFLDSFIEQKGV